MLFVYYLMGISGAVWLIWANYFPEAPLRVIVAETVSISLFLFFWHRFLRKKTDRRMLLCVPAVLVFVWRMVPVLKEGFFLLYRFIFVTCWNHFHPSDLIERSTLEWSPSAGAAFGMVLALFAWLLYQSVVIRMSRMTVLLLLFVPVAAVLAVGVAPSMGAVSLLLFCSAGVFSVCLPGRRRIQNGRRLRKDCMEVRRETKRKRSETYVRNRKMAGVTAACAVLLAISNLLVQPFAEVLEEQKKEARQWVWETFPFTSFDHLPAAFPAGFPGTSAGNGTLSNVDQIHYTGETIVQVSVEEKPQRTVYLKNYSGSIYTGRKWEQSEDGDELHVSEYPGTEPDGMRVMEVLQEKYPECRYVPYYSWKAAEADGNAVYLYCTEEEYAAWNAGNPGADTELTGREQYLEWPERLELLRNICEENPQQGIERIRNFIVTWLSSQCTYNLQVGRFPEKADPVEYFLFEKREGYCQHFASAAVMMFRMYGIPARYVTGLAVSPERFQYREDELCWTADATDFCAHAWVEIWMDDFGWLPVEVTPGGAGQPENGDLGNIMAALPEETEELQQEPTMLPEEQLSAASDSERVSGVRESDKKTEENGEKGTEDTEKKGRKTAETAGKILSFLGTGILCAAFAFLCFLVRRGILLKIRERKNYDGRFRELRKLMEKGGLSPDTDWLAEDFSEKVSEKFPWLEKHTVEILTETEAALLYGNRTATDAEKRSLHKVYLSLCRNLCRKMNGFQRFRFRMWDCWY